MSKAFSGTGSRQSALPDGWSTGRKDWEVRGLQLRSVKVVSIVGLLAAVLSPAAHADTRTETRFYAAATDSFEAECDVPFGLGPGVGGVCFYLHGNESEVAFTIDDDNFDTVGGGYRIYQRSGRYVNGSICGAEGPVPIPADSVHIEVYVGGPATTALSCLRELGVGSGTSGSVTATYTFAGPRTHFGDHDRECIQGAPSGLALEPDGTTRELRVRVLLDGIARGPAEAVVAEAAGAYEPLGIELTGHGYDEVDFGGVDAQFQIDQAKDHFQNARPAGSDVVVVLTDKLLEMQGLPIAGGLADCNAGVRYDDTAFAVVRMVGDEAEGLFIQSMPGVETYFGRTARILAHEVGHLMGGHHHYANCVEGLDAPGDAERTPCTLMYNDTTLLSMRFSTLNAAVVRGIAETYLETT